MQSQADDHRSARALCNYGREKEATMFLCRVLEPNGHRQFKFECENESCKCFFINNLRTYIRCKKGDGEGRFCSITCASLAREVLSICVVCKEITVHNTTRKTCGRECREIHDRQRTVANKEKRKISRDCKQCGAVYRRIHLGAGFCSRSCGARWNIEHGNCEEWRLRTNEKTGKYLPCTVCETMTYVEKRHLDDPKHHVYCSPKCGDEGQRRWMIENNPNRGKKASEESKQKQRSTLYRNHGITNAGLLAVGPSKGQCELFTLLAEHYRNDDVQGPEVLIETLMIHVDMLVRVKNAVIEYNGSYWHADRRFYQSDAKIGRGKNPKTAQDVWKRDENRIERLNASGLRVFTMWEHDFIKNRVEALERLFVWLEREPIRNGTSSVENAVSNAGFNIKKGV